MDKNKIRIDLWIPVSVCFFMWVCWWVGVCVTYITRPQLPVVPLLYTALISWSTLFSLTFIHQSVCGMKVYVECCIILFNVQTYKCECRCLILSNLLIIFSVHHFASVI